MQNKAVGCQDKPRTAATHVWGVARISTLYTVPLALHLDIHHCWADFFCRAHDRLRIGIEQLLIRQGRGRGQTWPRVLGVLVRHQS